MTSKNADSQALDASGLQSVRFRVFVPKPLSKPGLTHHRWRCAMAVGSVLVCLCLTSLPVLTAAAQVAQATGRETAQEVKRAAGRTVWDGIYTEQQAARGRIEYAQSCASCHADDLRGRSTAPSLVEESFAFLWGEMTVGDLFERIRTQMPPDRPNSLSSQSYVDIIAFILQKNEFPPAEKELTGEGGALRQILITTKRP